MKLLELGNISLVRLCVISVSLMVTHTVGAQIKIGGNLMERGTTIEVYGPFPDLDIQGLIDGITDASAAKPYLIKLGAGSYDLSADNVLTSDNVVMKPYVSIKGSGQDATFITSAVSTGFDDSRSAVITGADNAALADLSIINTGDSGSGWSIAIYNSSSSPQITNVKAFASGGSINAGFYNVSSSPEISNLAVSASGGSDTYGVRNTNGSSPVMTNVDATATGGSNVNYGVRNDSSSPVMTNIRATVTGGGPTRGIGNFGTASPTMHNVFVDVSAGSSSNWGVRNSGSSAAPKISNLYAKAAGSDSYGVWNEISAAPQIANSWLEGGTRGVSLTTGARIVNTGIVGGVADTTGTQCLNVYDGNLSPLSC